MEENLAWLFVPGHVVKVGEDVWGIEVAPKEAAGPQMQLLVGVEPLVALHTAVKVGVKASFAGCTLLDTGIPDWAEGHMNHYSPLKKL